MKRRDLIIRGGLLVGGVAAGIPAAALADNGMGGSMPMPANPTPKAEASVPAAEAAPVYTFLVDDGQDLRANWAISVSRWEFLAGLKYRFDVTNAGTRPHEIMVMTQKADDEMRQMSGMPMSDMDKMPGVIAHVEADTLAKHGDEATFDVVFSEPGSYVLGCHVTEKSEDGSIVDHYALGMHATVTVKPLK